jgi:protein involved in polysaccharide export with SLBB domain
LHCSHQAFGLYNLGFHNGSRFNVPMPLRPTLVRGIAAVFRSARLSLLFVLSVTLHGLVQAQAMPAAAAAVAVEATRLPAVPALVQPAARAAEPAARPGEATAAAPVTTIPARPQPTPLPPEANEFQRFVLTNTGQTLPVFGTEYFQSTGLGYQPADQMPVPADYVLGAGDELLIRGWGTVDIDLRAPIDRGGQIHLPRVGSLTVAGLKAGEVEEHLRAQVARLFKGFTLNVTLGRLRSIQVFVVGQARQPGTYTVGSLSTLVNAVFASGGPGPNGSMRRVQLKRGNAVVTELDLYDFIVRGDRSRDVRLQSGDVIVYAPAGPRVAVLGAVDTPAVYELRAPSAASAPGAVSGAPVAGSTLAEVLVLAGGNRAHANARQVLVDRIDPANAKTPRQVELLSLADAQSTPLRDGDILTLPPVAPQFGNAITLRGNVAAPLRYPFTPGMRISQLIPERDALITPEYHVRKNRLVQYLNEGRTSTPGSVEQSVRNIVDEPNWEYAIIERLDTDRITVRLIPFHLGKAVLEKDPAHDLPLQPGDVVTIFGSKDIRVPQTRTTRLVRVEGEIERPGVYQLQAGDTLRAVLQRAGGVTPQAYLFGTEFARERTRQKQREALDDAIRRLEASLASAGSRQSANAAAGSDAATAGRLREVEQEARNAQISRLRALRPNGRVALELPTSITKSDELPDVPLEDGDTIVIPARPGFVFAVGAVANENALLWRPGRKVKDYLLTAGLLRDAEESELFVARADGSVVQSRDRNTGFWAFGAKPLDNLELAPGDTIVVPEKLDRESPWHAFVRGAKDWTQILSNFGIAAAAIRTLSN